MVARVSVGLLVRSPVSFHRSRLFPEEEKVLTKNVAWSPAVLCGRAGCREKATLLLFQRRSRNTVPELVPPFIMAGFNAQSWAYLKLPVHRKRLQDTYRPQSSAPRPQ